MDNTCEEAIRCIKTLREIVSERFFDDALAATVCQRSLDDLLDSARHPDSDFLRLLALMFMLRIREIIHDDGENGRLINLCNPYLESMSMRAYAHRGYKAHREVVVQLRKVVSRADRAPPSFAERAGFRG